jgi:DNA replication and repair protein RecF
MRLLRLQTAGFRNLVPGVLDVDAPLVVFAGRNGQGKTNLLEAVGVLGTLRSFRTARAGEMVAWGAAKASVEAVGVSEGMTRTWRWSFGQLKGSEGERRLERDDRAIDAVTWLSSLRATHFVPGDVSLVRGEPAERRALLDRAVLTVRPAYLGTARDFRKVSEHRAALLRTGTARGEMLDVLDAQLARLGAEVTAARAEVLDRLVAPFERAYAAFVAGEPASVRYRAWLGDGDRAVLEQRYLERLGASRPDEIAARRVLGGPQRDDVVFAVHGQPARAFASQGQARSLVLAWKLAELEVARQGGETPLFLLDDLGSELDPERTSRLVTLVRSLGAQVFVTTTDIRFLPAGGPDPRVFEVDAGGAAPFPGDGAERGRAG